MDGLSSEVTGVVTYIGEVETYGNDFKVRRFRIQTPGDYPQTLEFELLKDNVDKADYLTVGKNAKVSFNIRGNEWKERCFTKLVAWKVFGNADGESRIDDGDVPGAEDAPF